VDLSLDEAFQAIVRGAVEESFAPLEASLRRIFARLSGQEAPPRPTTPLRPTPRLQSVPTPPPPPPEAKAQVASETLACAIVGCKRPSRSKGYCSAHYQKRRNLVATDRLPASWVEFATPQSVPDVALPRGRAASRDREPTPEPATTPPAPTGPRVWVRKKGQPQLTEAIPGSAESGKPAPMLSSVIPLPTKVGNEDVQSTVKRWAAEFLADKRPR